MIEYFHTLTQTATFFWWCICMGLFSVVYCSYRSVFYSVLHVFRLPLKAIIPTILRKPSALTTTKCWPHWPGSWLPLAALFSLCFCCALSFFSSSSSSGHYSWWRKRVSPRGLTSSFLLCFTSRALAVVLLVDGRRAEGQRGGHSDCCLFRRLFRQRY